MSEWKIEVWLPRGEQRTFIDYNTKNWQNCGIHLLLCTWLFISKCIWGKWKGKSEPEKKKLSKSDTVWLRVSNINDYCIFQTLIFLKKSIGRIKRPLHTFKTSSSKASSMKCHSILYTISIGVEKKLRRSNILFYYWFKGERKIQ